MQISKLLFISQMMLLVASGQLKARQENSSAQSNEGTQIEAPLASENAVIQIPVVSPLLAEDVDHGRLLLSGYDAEHLVYPVKIVAIDNWLLPADVTEKELRLAEGVHQMIVLPDFSNIDPQFVFMSSPWKEKHISFTLLKKQDVAVTARIIDKQELSWQVQIYQVQLPVKDIPEVEQLISISDIESQSK